MWSIFFYIGPNMAEFQATGYVSKGDAIEALDSHTCFINEVGDYVHIPYCITSTSIAVIKEMM